jgi:hypothetical protein
MHTSVVVAGQDLEEMATWTTVRYLVPGEASKLLSRSSRDREEHSGRASKSQILEKIILACSDQQVFTGGAYALTLRYWRGCDVSAYHYNVVSNMLLLSCATHLMSISLCSHYWKYP